MLLGAHKGPQRFPDWANRGGGAGEDIHCDGDDDADVHHDGGEDGDDASQDNDPHHQDI